ncbi:hypothetical protein D3C74_218840 [compost metagenome]
MRTYGIYMDGKKSGSVKTNDIHGYASKVCPQGYKVDGNKLIAGSISFGEAMAIGMKKVEEQERAEFGTYAAHQPNHEGFKQLGKLDDYAYQSLVHMQTAAHHLSWALTVLDHADVPADLQEEVQKFVRQTATISTELQDWLRDYTK